MSRKVVLVGGPSDGKRLTVIYGDSLHVPHPVEMTPATYLDDDSHIEPATFRHSTYRRAFATEHIEAWTAAGISQEDAMSCLIDNYRPDAETADEKTARVLESVSKALEELATRGRPFTILVVTDFLANALRNFCEKPVNE